MTARARLPARVCVDGWMEGEGLARHVARITLTPVRGPWRTETMACVVHDTVTMDEAWRQKRVSELVQGLPLFGDDGDDETDSEDDGLPQWIEGDSLAPYCTTAGAWLDDVLLLADTKSDDVVCDVGCGDGRIPIWAVQRFQVERALGIEIDSELAARSLANAAQRGVGEQVQIIHGDATDCGNALDDVTVMTAYLLPASLPILKGLFLKHLRKKGRRLVTIGWGIDFLPERAKFMCGAEEMSTGAYIYLYDHESLSTVGDPSE